MRQCILTPILNFSLHISVDTFVSLLAVGRLLAAGRLHSRLPLDVATTTYLHIHVVRSAAATCIIHRDIRFIRFQWILVTNVSHCTFLAGVHTMFTVT